MRRAVAAFAVLVFAFVPLFLPSPPVTAAQEARCAPYDSWVWAQTVLAPETTNQVCDDLPEGFAPATWTDTIPASAIPATVTGVTDGDTLKVTINGQPDTVRLYRADAPEVQACGGSSATAFVQSVLGYNDAGTTVYLESDATDRDRYDRKLAYVWLEIDGNPYMLNETLVRSGFARDVDYGDRLYADQMATAKAFAKRWSLGAWAECGGFDADAAASDANSAPAPQSGPGAGTCDPSYPDFCIPPIEVTGDLDCGDVAYRRFTVIPPDPHGFDGDHDGIGCEGS